MAKAALMNARCRKGRDLDEAEAQQVLAWLIKQRRDSIEQFRAARTQRIWSTRETAEIGVLERYAPPAASGRRISNAPSTRPSRRPARQRRRTWDV